MAVLSSDFLVSYVSRLFCAPSIPPRFASKPYFTMARSHVDSDQAANLLQTGTTFMNLRFPKSNANLRLAEPILDILSVSVQNIQIPFSYYTVTPLNNRLIIKKVGSAEFSDTITPGSYSGTRLAQALKAILDAATGLGVVYNDVTVGWDPSTFKFTFSQGSAPNIEIEQTGVDAGDSILPFMGFTTAQGPDEDLLSDTIASLNGPTALLVKSNALSSGAYRGSTLENEGTDVINTTNTFIKVPVRVNPSYLIASEPFDQTINYELATRKRIAQLDFRLVDAITDQEVDLQGQEWAMTLRIKSAIPS